MSRSDYSDDMDDPLELGRYRGRVASALRGKRGQAFLKEMLIAMDAMPIKRLIANDLETTSLMSCSHWGMFEADSVCAIGTVGRVRGVDMSRLDPDDAEAVAAAFSIAEVMAREIVYMNDEAYYWSTDELGHFKRDASGKLCRITPEERFQKVREWIVSNIKNDTDQPAPKPQQAML